MSQFDLKDIPEDHQQDLELLLKKWRSMFSKSSLDLGCTNVVKHMIDLVDETPFKEKKPKPIPHGKFQEVKQHISLLLDIDILRPSMSP